MSSSSEASSSSARGSSSPEPPKNKALKRKRLQEAAKDQESDESDASSNSDEESGDDGEGNDMDVDSDKPVVSHAERRRQRRREKLEAKAAAAKAEADSDSESDSGAAKKKRKLKDGAKDSTKEGATTHKRQNSIWVGNLSFKTTQENLRAFFKEVGEITRIHLPTKPSARPNLPQENRGFAYVDFATPEAKTAAIALSEQPCVGRKLLIKDGGDFAGRPIVAGVDVTTTDSALGRKTHSKTAQKILRNQKQPPAPTLFLGNLPFETTDDDIRQLFEAHRQKPSKKEEKAEKVEEKVEKKEGVESTDKDTTKKKADEFILKIRMGTFEDTGACKGFAFVDFSSIDNATSALIDPKNHNFNGRELKVEFAGADAVRRGAAKHLLPGYTKDKPTGGKKDFGGKRPFNKSSGPRTNTYDKSGGQAAESSEPSKTRSSWKTTRDAPVEAADTEGDAPREQRHAGKPAPAAGGDRRQAPREYKGPRARPKPGAALALAKRETFAILPSEGKKITF